MFGLFRPGPEAQLERFLQRYGGRTLIIHEGFPSNWMKQLLRQAGGGGHFRIDARPLPAAKPTPVEWLVQTHILPIGLPLPLLARVEENMILLRHLNRDGYVVHPSEIAWFLAELSSRHHAALDYSGGANAISVTHGLAISDNEPLCMWDAISG
ncbi:hypothetical protein SAMN05216526_1250 [Ectothiorhodosinus mongolicus]|uniref:Uncharacterized protein n=1 Tax=Ectothiorhodosinus mongolicus TaxID=233100 RepID=A0A1R3W000_9GAMM|nr:hypothetical protein [Ectothiorhodosinus mongolicus]ULX57153.1 hypothetical protein CKX93_05265 [Ectothiorhodosinus mongolicus]SIT70163.1 hypothetical protein SAMN05216526_1250 [Ectothiorhodosinus mongolicus]